MSNLVKSRRAQSRGKRSTAARAGHSRLSARSTPRKVRRDWNRRGQRPVRFSRLRAALTVLERRPDGHHVVAFDPSEREGAGSGRRGQRRSPRGREEPRVSRGRRLIREGEEDIDEVVATSRKRAMKTGTLAEGDKIQIEVGAVKGLQAKRGVKRGAFWIVALSLLLFWVPVLGPAVAGYVGGRKAGTPLRAFFAALLPILGAFAAFAALAASTVNVPALVRHMVEAGSAGIIGTLPFDFPILGYVLGNLAAVMRAGPDALFLLLAFALVGGAVSEMKLQERMVPPITARIPASRVVSPMTQTPARAVAGAYSTEVDGLVAKLNDALVRAEKERRAFEKARGGVPSGGGWGRPRGFFGRGNGGGAPIALSAEADEPEMGSLDPAGRRVVAQMLASTPPAKGDRRAKALRLPEVEFDLPQTIAFAGPSRAPGAEGRSGAHQYRPSKYYHIYGGSVNPVARAKLEKRLRRTHTLHAMRRGTRSFAQMVEVDPEGHHAVAAHQEVSPDRPRSLETAALTAEMHYDALEHLENASFAAVKHKAAPVHHVGAEDDLGGLIAHLGEGGEAVVEQSGVRDVEFGDGPVFDRRGRQRARIADDEPAAPSVTVKPAKPKAAPPTAVREAIESVLRETEGGDAAPDLKAKVARSFDRAEMTSAQSAKVNRWLKRTLETTEVQEAKAKPKAVHEPATEEAHPDQAPRVKSEAPVDAETVEHKPAAHKPKGKQAAPAFEITHGSTEVDAEADAGDDDGPAPKKHRSAADILREIKAQKKAEKDAEPGEEVAGRAKLAKQEADEIERHAREGAVDSVVGEVALAAEAKTSEPAPKASSKRRSRGDDLEEVKTDAEKLGSDLELTLAPIRDEQVEIREIGEVHAEAAPSIHATPAAAAGIPQVGEGQATVEVTEIQTSASRPAFAEPERDVKPGEVVLAGPSTDVAVFDPGEGELSAHDQERIRRRLQEGWNRL